MSRQLVLRLFPVVAYHQVELAEAEELLIAGRRPLHTRPAMRSAKPVALVDSPAVGGSNGVR